VRACLARAEAARAPEADLLDARHRVQRSQDILWTWETVLQADQATLAARRNNVLTDVRDREIDEVIGESQRALARPPRWEPRVRVQVDPAPLPPWRASVALICALAALSIYVCAAAPPSSDPARTPRPAVFHQAAARALFAPNGIHEAAWWRRNSLAWHFPYADAVLTALLVGHPTASLACPPSGAGAGQWLVALAFPRVGMWWRATADGARDQEQGDIPTAGGGEPDLTRALSTALANDRSGAAPVLLDAAVRADFYSWWVWYYVSADVAGWSWGSRLRCYSSLTAARVLNYGFDLVMPRDGGGMEFRAIVLLSLHPLAWQAAAVFAAEHRAHARPCLAAHWRRVRRLLLAFLAAVSACLSATRTRWRGR
jgi:hypothetical protein